MLPIILIHGFPFDSQMWRDQAQYLRSPEGGGHTVITPDLPGFGPDAAAPAPAKERATIEGYAQCIHELIQQHGGRAVVGGFSMGGYVMLALLRDYPDDVAAAMLIDTRPDPDTPEARANRLKTIEEVSRNGPATLFETMTGRVLGKRPGAGTRQQVRALMDRVSVPAIVAAQAAMARRHDQSDLLPQLRIPVLILVGAEDAITPPSVAVSMQSHMPHAMLVQIVSAGHMTPVEQPAAVNAALKAFLATVKP